ncbi:hypothetical protein TKK_0014506 [Trichogramma kaykai]|uniref:Integrase catalytic domain-containing protein n=1 Tax=Trichogramma kaykai TaxID=54128 RepID=A0ABD2WDF4_9HYME
MTELAQLIKDQRTTGKLIENFQKNTKKLGEANLTFDTLNTRLSTLESYWKTFFDRHLILARNEEGLAEDSYFVNDEYSDAENHYTCAKSFIMQRLAAISAQALDGVTPTPAGAAPVMQLSTTSTSLPKLTLPKFSGQQAEWDSFKSLFTSMVKDSATLTPTLKLQHLLACVEGDARRTIKNIEVNGDNFEVAWTALSRRYENKRLRISVYMKRLLYMPKATKKSVEEYTRLLDTTNECRRGLSSLGEPVDHWDRWFVSIIVFNLDTHTRELWEQHLPADGVPPSYEQLIKFLENRVQALDTANCADTETSQRSARFSKETAQKSKSISAHHASGAQSPVRQVSKCTLCTAAHRLGSCPEFNKLSVDQRWKYARDQNLCFNCLSKAHKGSECPSAFKCRACKQLHHTKLHRQQSKPEDTQSNQAHMAAVSRDDDILCSHASTANRVTLLGTAQITAVNERGDRLLIRALIDPGSEGSFITEKVVQALSLRKTSTPLFITGVDGGLTATAKTSVLFSIRARFPTNNLIQISAAVLPKVSGLLPKWRLNGEAWSHLKGLKLADPAYDMPASVYCLIGAELYPEYIGEGLRRGPAGSPSAYNTVFGWVITGPTVGPNSHQESIKSLSLAIERTESLGSELRKFWELEEIPSSQQLTPKEELCEEQFSKTCERDTSGRYIVRLPFVEQPELPGSLAIAKQRFLATERRLINDPRLYEAYRSFMQEYETLGHMKKSSTTQSTQACAYLPHHAVVTKKLRVVFNASQPATNGKSLNDFLHVGAKLQVDISTVLLRWRLGQYAFTADIIKMYRQIRVSDNDTMWQRILWRSHPEDTLQAYDLTTVTYGTACAPYLALRILQQLADDEENHFPAGAAILRNHMYVDDALVSCDSEAEAIDARLSLTNILRSAGMELDKWASNCPAILPKSDITSALDRTFDKDLAVPTLGLRWTPKTDVFSYTVPELTASHIVTKRSILSEVARIFDPTGWIAPVTVRAKMLLQHLWLQGRNWDQLADPATTKMWLSFRRQLPALQQCHIPRWIGTTAKSSLVVHGFSDASEKAYAAAIYLVSDNKAHLITAKSKVAPIRAVSLPRLELCGATLLARLMRKTLDDLGITTPLVYCWTDSQIVLAWLRAPPSTWKAFVANRVSGIHTSLPNASWGHVASKQNPADLASRGCTPHQLKINHLWWKGPSWIISPASRPKSESNATTQLEKRSERTCLATSIEDTIETILARFSCIKRMLRVVAYCRRWKHRIAPPGQLEVTAAEIDAARIAVTRAVQALHFPEDVKKLQKDDQNLRTSKLLPLRPYLDEHGQIRVGGRLNKAHLSYDEQHPIIVPKASHLANLLIYHAHTATLHGGPQLAQSFLLRRWWIIHGRNLIRRIIQSCVTCCRFQGRRTEQRMAPYPEPRVTPSRPFTAVGVDYAGPFTMRASKGRGKITTKGYVAIFVCFATRAAHLEVVSDYSSKTFLLALRRFFARRGLSQRIFSDCGTTFQGAANELQKLFHESSAFSQTIKNILTQDEIKWEFIPPRAPHFGGLWEAAVKAFKFHLKRIVGDVKLTYEEFATLASQIEACLNSRPLCPLSANPQDLAALTPGHFLIGSAMLAPPEPYQEETLHGVPRWRHTLMMRNHFWRRWQKEVLQTMQIRRKWQEKQPDVQPGELVLIIDDLQPPQRWPLARIQEIHPGPDGLVRVVTVRTATTTLRRPIAKIVRLPVRAETPVTV